MKRFVLIAALLIPATLMANEPGAHFIENWDLDADGAITLAELEEKRADVFYAFDADDDGVLTAAEYAYFNEARAADMENMPEQARAGMSAAEEGMTLPFNDTDGNGSVSREEFLAAAKAWLVLIDRDGSGDITAADFHPQDK